LSSNEDISEPNINFPGGATIFLLIQYPEEKFFMSFELTLTMLAIGLLCLSRIVLVKAEAPQTTFPSTSVSLKDFIAPIRCFIIPRESNSSTEGFLSFNLKTD